MRLILLIYSFCLIFFCACTNEETENSGNSSTDILTIANVVVESPQWTKAGELDTLTTDSIGVYRLAVNNYSAKKNLIYKYVDSWWGARGNADTLCLNSAIAQICAYYPYAAAGITNSSDITKVTLKTQKYSIKEDLCYQTVCSVKNSSPKAKFSMNRAFAKLTFVITHQQAYTGACYIDSIAILHSSIRTKAVLNVTNGVMSDPIASSAGYRPQMTIAENKTDSTQMLMVSGAVTQSTEKFKAVFWLDGLQRSIQFVVPDNKFVAGYNYRLPIIVTGKADLIIQGISITDWESGIYTPVINL